MAGPGREPESATEIVERLSVEHERLSALPAEQVLGLEAGADEQHVRRAFGEAAKRFHPQMYGKYRSREVTDIATRCFMVVQQAQAALLAKIVRPRNVVQHGAGRKLRPRQPTASQTAQIAELSVIKAIRDANAGAFDTAEAALQKALKLDPNYLKARIWLHVTRARRCKRRGDLSGQRREYENVLTLDSHWREALEVLGRK